MHEARATIKFDFSESNTGIPSDASINKAILAIYRTHEPKLNLSYGYDQDGQIFCNPSTVDWSTSTEGFRTLFPQIVDGHDTRKGDTLNYIQNTIDWLEFDVTDIISEMIVDSSNNNGFILRGFIPGSDPTSWGTVGNTSVFDDPGHSGINGGYASCEYNEISKRPKLTIVYDSDTPIKSNESHNNSNVSIAKYQNQLKIIGLSGHYIDIAFLTLNGRVLSRERVGLSCSSVSIELPDAAQNAMLLQIKNDKLNIFKKLIR